MAQSRLLLTAVPSGITNGQGLLTVLVSPQLNTPAEMNAMRVWTAALKKGSIAFNLDTPHGSVALTLNKDPLQPDLWPRIFGDAPFASFGQKLAISNYKVNLSVTRNHAKKLHKGFINRTDGSIPDLKKLHSDAAVQHGYYSTATGASAAAAGFTNKPADVVVARITGRSSSQYSTSNVTPAAHQAMLDMDKIKNKHTHILHHVHRLCAAPRARRSDTLDPQFLLTQSGNPTPPPMEFHERLSVLLNMTPVMDALGLILSFSVPTNQFAALQAVRVVAANPFHDPQSGVSIPFVSPFTNLKPSLFLPQRSTGAFTDSGWIDPSDGYQIDSLQLDSAAMHVYQFSTASALRQKNLNVNPTAAAANPDSDVTSQHNEDHVNPILPPSPHTGGLTVWQDDRQLRVQAKVQKAAKTTLDNSSRLNAEDLVSGIAVDVRVGSQDDNCADDKKWLHLTRRNERYEFQASKVAAQDREHGVRTAAARRSDTTQSGPNDYDVDETIFTWKLGSLVVKTDTHGVAPLRSQGRDKLTSHSVPWRDATKTMTAPSAIPSPIFGETYGVAMRPVYVTGRPVPFDCKTAKASSLPPTKFVRYEVIQGPAVIPVKFTEHYSQHEHRTLMIVGGKIDENLKPHVYIPSSLRALAPMSVTPEVARRHGKTDDQLEQGSTVFQLNKGSLPDEVKRRDGASTGVYLPDPLCTGVIASLYDIEGKPVPGVPKQSLDYYETADAWPNYTVHFVELQPDNSSGKPSLTVEDFTAVASLFPFPIDKSKKIVCKLPLGKTAVLRLTPQLSPDTDSVHALVGLLDRGHSAQDSDICRPTHVRLTYATDLPIEAPDVLVSDIKGNPATPNLDRTASNVLQLAVTAESFSTSKVAVIAKWTDLVDDLAQSKWSSRDSNARLAEFALPKKPLPAGKWSKAQQVQLPFSDARYRQVKITPWGTSRGADVFLKDPSSVPPTLAGKEQPIECLATAAPPVPDVEYVVPTLQWDVQKTQHTRTMGLSVILNRPWYASGNGEQLAVIVGGSNANGMAPNQLPAVYSANQEDAQSAWGLHPDWAGYADIPPTPDKRSITVGEIGASIAVVQSSGTKYIVPFTPQYNEQDQQWFCNVKLSAPPAYGTVVRLIAARYQPMAVDNDRKLSSTVACDFALLGPQRCMVITRTGHLWNRKVRIQIYGVGAYYNKSAQAKILMTAFQVFRVSLSLTNTQDFNWQNDQEIHVDHGFLPQGTLLWQGTVSPGFLEGRAVLVREFENYPGAEDPSVTRAKEVYVDVFKLY